MSRWNPVALGGKARVLTVVLAALVVVGVVALAALHSPPAGPAAAECEFTVDGTTMTLAGDCTTDATIEVPDGFTLDGAGFTITGVDPPGGHFTGAVVGNGGAVAAVRNVRVTVQGLANVCDDGDARLRGILFKGASGSIRDSVVTGINQGASGCQEGNGIEVRNEPFDGTHPATVQVTISDNEVTGYQKTGIVANGDVLVAVTGNTVVGLGPIPYIAQNGIQLGYGAMGTVRGNEISGNAYTACSNQDAAKTGCVPWVSTGLLLYDVDMSGVQASMNTFRDNQRNMVVLTSASLGHP